MARTQGGKTVIGRGQKKNPKTATTFLPPLKSKCPCFALHFGGPRDQKRTGRVRLRCCRGRRRKGSRASGFHVGKTGESQGAEKSRTQGHTRSQQIPAGRPGTRGRRGGPVSSPLLGGLLAGAQVACCHLGEQPFQGNLSGREGEGHRVFLRLLFHNDRLQVNIPKGPFWVAKLWSPLAGKRPHVYFGVHATSLLNADNRSPQRPKEAGFVTNVLHGRNRDPES